MNLSERTYLWHLLPLRLWIGYYMFNQGFRKFSRDFPHRDWLSREIGEGASKLFPWYRSFLNDVVIPHSVLFGNLVMWGEILVGACLILGLLTRWSSLVGLFMMVNYIFGPGMARGGAALAQQETFSAAFLVFILSSPGRTLGLDGRLFRRALVKPAPRRGPPPAGNK
jgi:uncharacterized membrane protein YphA (DoxX/SURF4 family)